MSTSKLETARELIQQKRYTEARKLLKTMRDNSTAQRWLAKLDEIAPEAAEKQRGVSYFSAGIVIVALLVAATSLVYAVATRSELVALSAQATQIAQLPTAAPPTELPTAVPTETPQDTATHQPTVTPTTTLTPIPTDTPLPSTTPVPSSTPTPETYPYNLSDWFLLTQVSPFTDEVIVGVVRDANSSINAWISNPTPTLFFRCGEGKFDVFIAVGTTIENDPTLMDQVRVTMRYDQETAFDEITNVGIDEDRVIFTDPRSTLNAMLSHETLAFGFTPYNANFTYTTFTLTGLREAVKPVLDACNVRA